MRDWHTGNKRRKNGRTVGARGDTLLYGGGLHAAHRLSRLRTAQSRARSHRPCRFCVGRAVFDFWSRTGRDCRFRRKVAEDTPRQKRQRHRLFHTPTAKLIGYRGVLCCCPGGVGLAWCFLHVSVVAHTLADPSWGVPRLHGHPGPCADGGNSFNSPRLRSWPVKRLPPSTCRVHCHRTANGK